MTQKEKKCNNVAETICSDTLIMVTSSALQDTNAALQVSLSALFIALSAALTLFVPFVTL